jgi:hypothetical protein
MRFAALTLLTIGLLSIGSRLAVAQEWLTPSPTPPTVAARVDQSLIAPVHWYGYRPVPRWYRYGYYSPYYTYRPRYYSYGSPGYYDYYAQPYPGYYYPNAFGFQYYGPRRSFSFGY